MMRFDEFAKAAHEAGLTVRRCSKYHWQLLGGTRVSIVNCWPNSKKGFRFQTGEQQSQGGPMAAAIRLAGSPVPMEFEERPRLADPAPWEKVPEPERVGLIRWLWRLLW